MRSKKYRYIRCHGAKNHDWCRHSLASAGGEPVAVPWMAPWYVQLVGLLAGFAFMAATASP
jgi:hypothetical protein